jgi:hypothetical protein
MSKGLFLVTVTVPGTVGHDPRNKVTGPCPLNGQYCTDQTGKHHSFLVHTSRSVEQVTSWAHEEYGHVTRVESVPSVIQSL